VRASCHIIPNLGSNFKASPGTDCRATDTPGRATDAARLAPAIILAVAATLKKKPANKQSAGGQGGN